MSDDEFDWSSGDDAHLAATTTDITEPGEKRKLNDNLEVELPTKRAKSETRTTEEPSPNTTLANKILKERFGLSGFRLEQEKAITRLLDGGSAVVVFPTGGGKSLCYQVSIYSLS